MLQKFKKQHRDSESTWKVYLNKFQASKIGRAVGFDLVTPRNTIDKNLVFKHHDCKLALHFKNPFDGT